MWFIRPAHPPKGPEPDPEAGPAGGARSLYPSMIERPELLWAFIRKVYAILSMQMLITIAVSAVVVYYRCVAYFFISSRAGLGLYIFTLLIPFILLPFLHLFHRRHPWNMLLLSLFTIFFSFAIGLTCAFTSGMVILESVILTAVVVISLTLYTFWAARRGHDFSFLGPFLFAAIMILLVYALIQLFLPMNRISLSIYGALTAVIFCGYIIYDTDNLVKRCTYDDYVWAAVALHLDIINLFLALLTLSRAN